MVFELIYGFCLSLNLNWSGPAWTKLKGSAVYFSKEENYENNFMNTYKVHCIICPCNKKHGRRPRLQAVQLSTELDKTSKETKIALPVLHH